MIHYDIELGINKQKKINIYVKKIWWKTKLFRYIFGRKENAVENRMFDFRWKMDSLKTL